MKKIQLISLVLCISINMSTSAEGRNYESEEQDFSLNKLVDRLDHPWSLSILPGSEGILITERSGSLFLFSDQKLQVVEGLPNITAIGQGGLLEIIFRAEPKSSGGIHFGSRLLLGTDGYLYITLGERGNKQNAQDLSHHGGSVIRINPDGPGISLWEL